MEIIYKKIEDLKPYKRNPRKNEEAVEYVANSIKEFGFKVPIIIDKNNEIIAGHTRLLASKELKLKEVPCIIADDLTEEQVKSFRLADNKVGEIAEWDFDLLEEELNNIVDINMQEFNFEFNFDKNEKNQQDDDDLNKKFEKSGCENYFKANFYSNNKWGIPYIYKLENKEINLKEVEAISFNYIKTTKDLTNKLVHFFIDDYQFERLWNNTDKYINMLKKAKYVLTPDFSLYRDMDLAIQLYNIYKSRWIGAYMQSEGIAVIPTISWSDERSYDFCFEGVENNSVVAISTYGTKASKEAKELFENGYKEMLKRIEPSKIICYGNNNLKNVITIQNYIDKKWRK